MINKKFFTVAALILFLALSIFASDRLFFASGELDSTKLYNAQGKRVDNLMMVDKNGYIIRTEEFDAEFLSSFAEITLRPNTLVCVLNINGKTPSIYLLDGSIEIKSTNDVELLTIYTTTSSYKVKANSNVEIIYTEDEDRIINKSQAEVLVYDSLRDKNITLSSYEELDILSYPAILIEEQTASIYSKSITFKDIYITISSDGANTTITLPKAISRGRIVEFFNSLDSNIKDSFTYRIGDDSANIKHNKKLENKAYRLFVDDISTKLLSYIKSLYRPNIPALTVDTLITNPMPAKPIITRVTTKVVAAIPEKPLFSLVTKDVIVRIPSIPEVEILKVDHGKN